MDGQITLFDTGVRLKEKVSCSTCACQIHATAFYGEEKYCEHWEFHDCPEAAKRTETNPDSDIHTDEEWRSRWCVGCYRALPEIKRKGKKTVICHTGKWRDYEQHRYMCPSYKKTTHRMEPCLNGMMINVWANGKKWCALCEAQGCEECYRQWEAEQELIEEYGEE